MHNSKFLHTFDIKKISIITLHITWNLDFIICHFYLTPLNFQNLKAMQKKLLTPSPSIYAEHADLEKQLIHTHSFELEGELCKKISKLESTYNFDPYIFEEGNLWNKKGY